MIATLWFSFRTIVHQRNGARSSGFACESDVISPSFGPRGDRIIYILLLPIVYSFTAASQIFTPEIERVVVFVRLCMISGACSRAVEVMFLLTRGKDHIRNAMPKEPINIYRAPP